MTPKERERRDEAIAITRYFLAKTIDNCENLDEGVKWTNREVRALLGLTLDLLSGKSCSDKSPTEAP